MAASKKDKKPAESKVTGRKPVAEIPATWSTAKLTLFLLQIVQETNASPGAEQWAAIAEAMGESEELCR